MKILLVDNHPLFVEGLQYLLEASGIEVTGVARNGSEALEQARELKPDIILMDINMPGHDGLEVLKLIKAEMPAVKTVILTDSEDDEDMYEAVRAGAMGYLLKNLDGKELVKLITCL